MQIPITGQAYVSASQATNYQRCLNMFPIAPGPDGVGTQTLLPTPGHRLLIDLGDSACRGMYFVNSYLYVVIGSVVRRLFVNTVTREVEINESCGSITTTSGTVYFSSNESQIILIDGSSTGYIIELAADNSLQPVTPIADTDFLGGTNVTYLDGYFIYSQFGTQKMFSSANQDGTDWDALDVASAEMRPDSLVGLGVTKGEIWAFGTDTIEVWYDAANQSGFPFSPRIGSGIDIGCRAVGSIVLVDNVLMWLDSRGYIVQSDVSPFTRNNDTGYALKLISTDAINNEIASYTYLEDAIAFAFNDRGHIIYQITFPNENKTWAFDSATGAWHEKSFYNSFTGQQEYHLAQYHAKVGNLNIVGGIRSGKIYIMDHRYFDDAEVPIHRLRTSAYQNNEFKLITVNEVELRLDCGYADQGIDPTIMLRYSNDNGHTWSHHLPRSMGKSGEFGKRITWNRLGTSINWLLEISIVDPVKFAIAFGGVSAESE